MKVIETTRDEAKTVAIAHPARFRIVKLLGSRQTGDAPEKNGAAPR